MIFSRLLAVFILVPLTEMLILIQLGNWLGFWPAVALVILTGFVGALLARLEGLRTWAQCRQALEQGQMPAEKMLDGLLVFAAGIVLITPGVLTDILGLILLVPFTRYFFKRWLRRQWDRWMSRRPPGSGPSNTSFFYLK